ncbi:MAG: hypothetical protein WCS87_12320, partial [Methylococcaceae bacterium]
NKAFRAQARISVSGTLYEDLPETPPRAPLGWPYSDLHLLLVIAILPESRIKNLKIEYYAHYPMHILFIGDYEIDSQQVRTSSAQYYSQQRGCPDVQKSNKCSSSSIHCIVDDSAGYACFC